MKNWKVVENCDGKYAFVSWVIANRFLFCWWTRGDTIYTEKAFADIVCKGLNEGDA